MSVTNTLREKLDYLVRVTGRPETELLAEAVGEGLTELYRKQIADAYLAGELEREKAIEELGEEEIEDLDYARLSIERDVKWGLQGE